MRDMTTAKRKDSLSAPTPKSSATPRRKPGPKPGTESARRGGLSSRAKYGRDYFALIGRKGGLTLSKRRGPEYFAEIGRHGGETTIRVHGVEHFSQIGKLSSEIRKKGGKRSRSAGKTAR
jgi:uncharacterized protein